MRPTMPGKVIEQADKVVLGYLLTYPERIKDISGVIPPEAFEHEVAREIYIVLCKMFEEEAEINAAEVFKRLDKHASVLGQLIDIAASSPQSAFEDSVAYIKNRYKKKILINRIDDLRAELVKPYVSTTDIAGKISELRELLAGENLTIAEKVRQYVEKTTGVFSAREIDFELGFNTKQLKLARRQILHRLKEQGVIEPVEGRPHGWYRRVEKDIEIIDWKNCDDTEYPIVLPFGISDLVSVFPKSIIAVAGLFNTGKTAFCLDIVRLNQGHLRCNYFTNEMGPNKLRRRLKQFENVDFPDGWNFQAISRVSNWADAIKEFPDDLNIIDYLQISENFWQISNELDQIFRALRKGVAVVCIQKSSGKELGRGGDFSAERASLYLSLNPGIIKIIKAKEWKTKTDPNGLMKKFELKEGWKFVETSQWIREEMPSTKSKQSKEFLKF